MRRINFIGVLTLAAACTAATPSTAPVTTPAPPMTVRLDSAVPSEQFDGDNIETNLTDKLSTPQAAREMYFGEIDHYADDDADDPSEAVPVLAVRNGDAFKVVPLIGPGLTNAGWKFVGSGPHPHEIWGALDTSAGDSRSNFVLAHSTDGGATFTLQLIHKPCKLMTFFDFAMDRHGHGRATLSLDADCGKHHPGLYNFVTRDDGKTWSAAPTFEADDMNRADTVPDDEQPGGDDSPKGQRTSLRSPVPSTCTRSEN